MIGQGFTQSWLIGAEMFAAGRQKAKGALRVDSAGEATHQGSIRGFYPVVVGKDQHADQPHAAQKQRCNRLEEITNDGHR